MIWNFRLNIYINKKHEKVVIEAQILVNLVID